LICIARDGTLAMLFNCDGMYRGCVKDNGEL
jgi:isoaspartyl peptidase/L-asparaginase-like protein (Ntn-hydrolase superfamily)